MPSNTITSYDSGKIKAEIDKKFIENDRGKPKGISQLLNQISFLENNEYSFDKFTTHKLVRNKLEIYPIIIYTDNQYSTPGINNYLSKKFKSKSANINQFKKVSLPIMIHLNFFQSYLAYIEKNRLDKIIDSYFNFVSRESRKSGSAKNPFPWLQSNLSFDDFNYKFDKSKKNKTNQAAVLFENLDFKNLKEMEKTSS